MFLTLLLPFAYSADCPPGYEWQPNSGVGCVQSNCYSVANAHLSYTGRCVCGSSGSFAENPDDPNKECYSDKPSCQGCVVACVHLDEDCPGEVDTGTYDSADSSYGWDSDYQSNDDSEEIDYADSGWGDNWGKVWDEWGSDGPDVLPEREREDKVINTEIDPEYYSGETGYESALGMGEEFKFDSDGAVATAEMNPFEFPGGNSLQELQDGVIKGWKAIRDWYQGDLPFIGEDGMWNWKSVHVDPATGERVEIKWVGADFQLGWNDGFKTQVYLADVSLPGMEGVDGYTVGFGISADWKSEHVKVSVGVPGTPISVNFVPRNIFDWLGDGVDKLRSFTKEIDIIKQAQDYQRRTSNN